MEKKENFSFPPLLFSACRAQPRAPLFSLLGPKPIRPPFPSPSLSLADKWGPLVSFILHPTAPFPSIRSRQRPIEPCLLPLPPRSLLPQHFALLDAREPEPPLPLPFRSLPHFYSRSTTRSNRRSAAAIHRPMSGRTKPSPPSIFAVVSAPPSPLPLRFSPMRKCGL